MISIDTQWVNRVKNTKTNGFFVFDFTLITIHLSFFLVCWLSLLYSIHLFNIPLLTLNSQFQLYSYLFQFFLFVVVLIIVVTKLYYGETVIITMVFFCWKYKIPEKNPARENER